MTGSGTWRVPSLVVIALIVALVSVACEQMPQNPTAATSLTANVAVSNTGRAPDLYAAQGPPLHALYTAPPPGRVIIRTLAQQLIGCYDVNQNSSGIASGAVEIRLVGPETLIFTIPGADGSCTAGAMQPLQPGATALTPASVRAVSQRPGDHFVRVLTVSHGPRNTGPLSHGF